MKNIVSKDVAILFAVSILVFILNIGGYPLFDVDEPRYAETAREMLTLPGDWITPHFNWVTRFDKPVLFYWLIAVSYKLFGVSEFSARLISALAATGIMFGLYFFVKNLFNRNMALITALIFATMLEVFAMARWAITDMTLACFMTGTWLSLFMVLNRSSKWYILAGLFGALGMLTKGPVALVLPGLTFLIAWWQYRRFQWKILFSPWLFAGLILCLALSLPWYIAVAKANPEHFVGSFFFLHNIQRFTSTVSGHEGPWYYYIPVIFIGAFPWILFTPALIWDWVQRRLNYPEFIGYASIWFWVVFLFFSISGTKLLTYILPAYPAFAMILAWYLFTRMQKENGQIKAGMLTRGLWVGAGIIGVPLFIAFIHPYRFVPPEIRELYTPLYIQITLFILLLTLIISAVLMTSYKKRKQGFWIFLSGIVLVLVFANMVILPEVAKIFQSDIVKFAKRTVKDNMPLATYRMKKPSLVFYTQQKVYFMPDVTETAFKKTKIKTLHSNKQALYLITRNRDLDALRRLYAIKPVESGHVYSLVQIENPNLKESVNQ